MMANQVDVGSADMHIGLLIEVTSGMPQELIS